ncbi:MAG: response regulator transcription factor [Candidatus Palauibacterales bacterium]|nr:response regulator transcription factor [Candidatus Palauibacterales bacterium]
MGPTSEEASTYTVVVHERDRVNGDLMTDHLSELGYLDVVGIAVTSDEALSLIDREEPDLVLSHANAPYNGSLRLAQQLRAGDQDCLLVVIGMTDDPGATLEYLEAGAAAYIGEDSGLEALDQTLREVVDGRTSLDPAVTFMAIRRLARLKEICQESGLDVGRLQRLTPREREVLNLLGEGLTNREIADRLTVEVSTVKSHVHSILEKLDAPTRNEAARYLLLASGENGDG